LSNLLNLQKINYFSAPLLFEDPATPGVAKKIHPGSCGAQTSWKNNVSPSAVGKLSLSEVIFIPVKNKKG
jgi:hypothetical protein